MRILILCLACLNLQASSSSELFAKYPNSVFVESGSYDGYGVLQALGAGFEIIYSIELSPELYQKCVYRFMDLPNIHLFPGDSAELLPSIIAPIQEPITFWLDGHYSGGVTAKGTKNSPILAELEAIRNHPIKTHTILIDDVRLMGTDQFDSVTLNEVILKVLEINPNYHLSFEDGHAESDILVAKVIE